MGIVVKNCLAKIAVTKEKEQYFDKLLLSISKLLKKGRQIRSNTLEICEATLSPSMAALTMPPA